ncbi:MULTISPECIES: YiiX/YebB-like N1pC/P60 family cysteine hydrolase [Asticcacaulis]|uniref:YiiX/YebB-like N1pC/P60 family cysteine hydrolase n=1 Tax=Asticcacaulis TaxID=76890 RepID=UPI001AE83FE5|nr:MULTISPECIES: YiiX/YebB-like N1pC/P60 family cysteine hydrolase [Asticcacaulis]MBP2161392.1 hypothetical protein [Asticcacaulis solisilvae]MDR6802437.1 hypothetical protein [Asticcacaulis sp. BE141]
MRRGPWIWIALILMLLLAVWRWFSHAPKWREGDLIFQTSRSGQSTAIAAATLSAYTHMGILARRGDGWVVIEAAGPVRETSLKAWIARGRFARYAVFRHPGLTAQQTRTVLTAARVLKGRPYDLFFSFRNRAIYCSELAWLAYGKAGAPVGHVQTVGSLYVGNGFADRLIRTRGGRDAECSGLSVDGCRNVILKRELVTPVAIARDRSLRQVYSNYPL